MANVRIEYVNKIGGTHEHITHLGNDTGTWTVAQVVAWIDSKQHTFYTEEGGKRAYVGVQQGAHRRYVQTHADGVWQNNLLALPPCKVAAA